MIHTLYQKFHSEPNPPVSIQKDFEAFVKKISSFADLAEKHIPKMQPFAENIPLMEYLFSLTDELEPLYETNQDFRYLLATFCYSHDERIVGYIRNLTDYFIEKETPALVFVLMILEATKNPLLEQSTRKLQQYMQDLMENSDYFRFVRAVGIDISAYPFTGTGGEGWFSFSLTTVAGKEYEFQCDNDTEKSQFYKFTVEFFTPRGSKKCFKMHLSSPGYHISFFDWERDYVGSNEAKVEIYFKDKNEGYLITGGENLMNLPQTLQAIEKLIGYRFDRNSVYMTFSRGIKGKKQLKEWIQTHI